MWGVVTYIRILTDQRYVPDSSGSSAKMAQKWAEMAFFFFFLKKPLKKTWKSKKKFGRTNVYEDVNWSAEVAPKWRQNGASRGNWLFFAEKPLKKIGNAKKKKYLRMLTDLRQVLDVTGSGAKMAQTAFFEEKP